MLAWNLTRKEIHYRHDAFTAGLRAAGYDVRSGPPQGGPGDVLLIWNRYGEMHSLATQFEAAGGTVVVAENGYLGPGGISPHAMHPRQIYALAVGGHNGQGRIPEGGPERFAALGVDLKPWRADGGHVLVCPNRSFGIPGRMMPSAWGADVCTRLAKLTQREIRLRPHPGNGQPKKPLAADLAGAWAVVIWSSSAGVQALVEGIPVICEAPYWLCKGAACSVLSDIRTEILEILVPDGMPDRLSAMQGLAWAQWHISEIEDGTAFRALLK